jgi:Ca2+-binding EF-hand superfamily protein
MKLVVLFFVLCAALVCANEEVGEKMTDEEIQELINDYKDLNKSDGENAPVN